MPANKLLALFFATILLVILAGCGGGSSPLAKPPMGGFTNANLSGMYAFSVSGTNASALGFFAIAGSFQADGSGHITSGVEDVNNSNGVFTNQSLTGTYTVRADGRGTATLSSGAGNMAFDFVIVSAQRALISRFENTATGSGSIDMQTSSAFSNPALAGAFAFSVAGIDSIGNPLAIAGNFSVDAAGNITPGVHDMNDNGTVFTNTALSGGPFSAISGNGRGTVSLTTALGARSFAFYVVDANHLKMVEIDTVPVLAGDAFRQVGPFSNASLSGPFAFTASGADVINGPFATGGVLTADGAGNVTTGAVDINDAGVLAANLALTGTYSVSANGRGTLALTDAAGTSNFAVYPSSGGVLAIETDLQFVVAGTALQQTGSFSNGTLQGTYAMNFTGATPSGEIDSITQFTASGTGSLTGSLDLNNVGSLSTGLALTGTYAFAANGRSPSTLQSVFGPQNIKVYAVNSSRALFIELDSNLVAVGDMQHQ